MARFTATQEQEAIFDASSSGRNVVVQARAGSGKTSTVEEDARRNKREALYLVYNTANKKEAEARFPRHVRPATGHSLAFRPIVGMNADYRRKFEAARGGRRIQPWDLASSAGITSCCGVDSTRLAAAVLKTVGAFQNSADDKVLRHHVAEDALPKKVMSGDDEGMKDELVSQVHRYAQKVWDMMADPGNAMPILHDSYLKLYQLSRPKLRDNLIYADEFQDANPVISSIINNQDHAQKILIGDEFQAIYGWRGAVNALQDAERSGYDVRHLSISFRFGNHIAALANIILGIRGEMVGMRGAGPHIQEFDPQYKQTVIARNNMTLFEHAVEAIENKSPFTIVGGSQDLVKLIESGYALYRDDLFNVRDEDLKLYESWDQLKELTEITGDATMKRLTQLIEKYRARSLDFIDDLQAADRREESESSIILTTAHKSKGRQWPQVHLCEDLSLGDELLAKINANKEPLTGTEIEQLNLLYVAVTRPELAIKLAPDVRTDLKYLNAILKDRRAEMTDHQSSSPTMAAG